MASQKRQLCANRRKRIVHDRRKKIVDRRHVFYTHEMQDNETEYDVSSK